MRQHHLLRPTCLHCLAENNARFEVRLPPKNESTFYLSHTPSLRYLKHLEDQFEAPVTTPATTDLPALVISFTLRLTSLSRLREERWLYVRFTRTGIVSTVCEMHISHFSLRTQKLDLPSARFLRSSATSSVRFTGKPSRAFHS